MKCIVIDDEPLAASLIENFVKRTPGLELTGAYTDPAEVVDFVTRTGCDKGTVARHSVP